MVDQPELCALKTNKEKLWLYDEYYFGNRDHEKRKSGQGENHWSGAKSLEWYTGRFVQGTMHGIGEYRWRYRGQEGAFVTYEGHYYANQMHGYGVMSYPDGRTFTGLFHSNIRWGPGLQSQSCLQEDVGLWHGTKLIRLAWHPPVPSVAPDLTAGYNGQATVNPNRVLLTTTYKRIGEIITTLELLKQCGSDPRSAAENWIKLHPKHCTDMNSQVCQLESFQQSYYKKNIVTLKKVQSLSDVKEDGSQTSGESIGDSSTYYAWNNNELVVHMMQHCFKHEKQRKKINLTPILSGPRNAFMSAGKHELDCRTLLMASYLGHTINVVQLVNEHNVHPEVADVRGNTALMYATCGDRVEIISFLVEAKVNVDSYNDSCCTPLGVALMRYACAFKDIPINAMIPASLPPAVIHATSSVEEKVHEWHINRDIVTSDSALTNKIGDFNMLRSLSKLTAKTSSVKKIKSLTTIKESSWQNKKLDGQFSKDNSEPVSNELFNSGYKRLYSLISNEYVMKVAELLSVTTEINSIPYVFEVNNMVEEVDANEEEVKKALDRNPKKLGSKNFKDTILKPSKDVIWQGDKDDVSIDSIQERKNNLLSRIKLTILQLLTNGANPSLVRCPQPALLMATISNCPDLVHHLIHYGVDVNEVYPQIFGFTALDVAVSYPFTSINVELIEALLKGGADSNHRLKYGDDDSVNTSVHNRSGPTLLHALLARKTETGAEEDVQRQVIELLLQYNCDATTQFKGRSAIDIVMTKNMDLFDVFVKSPMIDLNTVINEENQNILVKMFNMTFFKKLIPTDRLQILTNLVLFGADPLLKCQDRNDQYENIFVFAKKTLAEMDTFSQKPTTNTTQKGITKPDKTNKPEKPQLAVKSSAKVLSNDREDYKQAVDLVRECARLLHIRWLQGKLTRELVNVIYRYKHRTWNMIIREHKHNKESSLWLTPQRCLEIWAVLKSTRRNVYSDKRILKYLLYIVQYYNIRSKNKFPRHARVTASEKDKIESDMNRLLREQNFESETVTFKKYIKPELARKTDERFNICFECALPLGNEQIICKSCKMISFCCIECLGMNIDRNNCHPCSDYLKQKYFPSENSSVEQIVHDLAN